MNILLLGKNGQVGWALQRALQPLGCVTALDRHTDESGLCGDITDFAALDQVFAQLNPDIVVNAAAYTAVDQAETEREAADLINHLAVKHLAKLAKRYNSLLINYSTDYVFDGSSDIAWSETDSTAPINYYGVTKRAGEIALEQSGARYINFRTSWVYGLYGNNFIKTMLKLGQNRPELTVIDDQIGAPTSADLIADTTAQVLRFYLLHEQPYTLCGHYHLAASGTCSWYEYAKLIFAYAEQHDISINSPQVKPISTAQYPTPAKRPHNSRLNTNKLETQFELYLPNWQQGVIYVLGELLS